MPTTTSIGTCTTCTGCDPHGCGGNTCTRTCEAVYSWVSIFNDCGTAGDAIDCSCPDATDPCDSDHAGNLQQFTCIGSACVNLCRYSCDATGYGWVETTPCPSGCLCEDTLATCDAGHVGNTSVTNCGNPDWA